MLCSCAQLRRNPPHLFIVGELCPLVRFQPQRVADPFSNVVGTLVGPVVAHGGVCKGPSRAQRIPLRPANKAGQELNVRRLAGGSGLPVGWEARQGIRRRSVGCSGLLGTAAVLMPCSCETFGSRPCSDGRSGEMPREQGCTPQEQGTGHDLRASNHQSVPGAVGGLKTAVARRCRRITKGVGCQHQKRSLPRNPPSA